MVDVTNNTQRLIWMGNAMCVPGLTTTVDDVYTSHPRYVDLEASGDITTGAPVDPPSETRREANRPTQETNRPMQETNRPTQETARPPIPSRPVPTPPTKAS